MARHRWEARENQKANEAHLYFVCLQCGCGRWLHAIPGVGWRAEYWSSDPAYRLGPGIPVKQAPPCEPFEDRYE
jgi:hypothetical protein